MISTCLDVNEKGHLTIGGADTVDLAAAYGTPLYVMDETAIREACRSYKASIDEFYGGKGLPLYASKAFCCKEIYRIMAEEGMGADVVSGGELYTALAAGFPADKIFFHGNNKTEAELKLALEKNVGTIVADNMTELHTLSRLAAEMGRRVRVFLRIKPGIDAHTHNFIRTGQIDSKFGFALETGEAEEAARLAHSLSGLELVGLHCHIGSQIFELDPFCLAAEVMLRFMARLQKEGIQIKELNLGGGFGIRYQEEEHPQPYHAFMEKVAGTVAATCAVEKLETPYIYIEPGRSIVGPAGITLYTVGAVKDIPGVRTYVSIDGGMTDNPRYALYQAGYEVITANKAGKPRNFTVTVAGKCCESGDLIQENTKIQYCEPGDILAVLATGAYNYTMSSNYNRICRPPVVMVKDGEARVIVKGETYEDLCRNDM